MTNPSGKKKGSKLVPAIAGNETLVEPDILVHRARNSRFKEGFN
jgi:hypothetical protein